MTTTTIEPSTPTAQPTDGGPRGRLRRLILGSAEDPSWYRPLLLALLAATAIAYIVDITASDDANSFYAAAVQAGTKSWKALFFGSLDASNFITVDKPPAALWVMDISGRIFGFSSASMLIPEVLEGVISAALLSATVKRWYGAGAGLIAALIMVITPIAALMFRFNNPDALMVCLMVGAAYCLTRAIEKGSTRWMLGVGACIGFAFLAKMMEAFLVIPGFALVYFLAAPVAWRKRAWQLLAGAAAIVVCGGWWVAIDALWPASSRPYVDGSSDNSILNLIFGYNGIGRLDGSENMGGGGGGGARSALFKKFAEEFGNGRTGAAGHGGFGGGGGGGSMFGGAATITRMFGDQFGAQASWLLIPALLILAGGLIWRGRRVRTDRFRAGVLLWGSWLVVSGLVFSFSTGIIHTYYTVEFVPALAALVAIGITALWRQRDSYVARAMMAGLIAVTAAWSVILLQRDSSWQSWLTPLVIVTAALAIVGLMLPTRLWKRAALATALLGAVGCLAAPLAYTADTLSTAHTGSTPSAGPASTGGFGGFGRRAGLTGRGGFPGFGGGTTSGRGTSTAGRGGFGGGGMGDTKVSSALSKLLEESKGYRWAAITDGSQSAASLELASNGAAVAAIGGFDGQGGLITLAQFEKYVKAGDIHYYIASSGGMGGFGGGTTTGGATTTGGGAPSAPTGGGAPSGGTTSSGSSGLSSLFGSSSSSTSSSSAPSAPGGTNTSSSTGGGGFGMSSGSEAKILAWVKAHYTAQTVGGETIYNLSQPKS